MIVRISKQIELHPKPQIHNDSMYGPDTYTTVVKQRLSFQSVFAAAVFRLFASGAVATEDTKVEFFPELESSGMEGLRLLQTVEMPKNPATIELIDSIRRQGFYVVTIDEDSYYGRIRRD